MADVQVTCVSKGAPNHEAITGVGGAGGGGWWWTVPQVIESIETGTNTFYTLGGGKRSDVRVVKGPTKKYLRTHADGIPNDNLLALPSCPGH